MDNSRKLGTFLGVFTPTILTILGAIMYLRTGWLTGNLGLYKMLLAVVLANGITLITTLSFSSIATNIKLGTGGAYYVISRSLGIEIGGAIGIPLLLSQIFSVTLYAFGLAESFLIVFPGLDVQLTSFIIILFVGAISFLGAEFALKTQLPVMLFVALSILFLALGPLTNSSVTGITILTDSGNLNFWKGFAIFFPAVTGVMAGLGLSGDLKNPEKSIPRGSILAVLAGFLIYLIIPLVLSSGASRDMLLTDNLVWGKIAPLGLWVILPGLWGAIFSSAIGSMLGAPRTLEALANDNLAPSIFRKKLTGGGSIGLIVSLLIAAAAVFLGDLNTVAAVVTMFFLTVYGTINLAATFESLSGDSSWRPKFRSHWTLNLFGGLACFGVMFLINPIVGMIAIGTEILLWLYFTNRGFRAQWGDSRRGVYENLIRWSLLKLAKRPFSARNWRPHILAFVSDPVQHLDMIRFGNWFSQKRGVVTVCQLVVDDLLNQEIQKEQIKEEIQKILNDERIEAFAEVDIVDSVVGGITSVAQANGMAGLESNTILLGWPHELAIFKEFMIVVRRLENIKKSIILGKITPKHVYPRESLEKSIHIWWGGLQKNGDLMLLLAYLLTRNDEWKDSKIEVISIASNELMKKQTENYLNKLIPEIRIEAQPRVLIKSPEKSINDHIHEISRNAAVVFFGLATPKKGEEEAYVQRLEKLSEQFQTVFFVKNASYFVGELIDP